MKRVNITRIEVGSLAKLVGIVNAIVALALGIISAIVATVGVVSNNDYSILSDVLIAIGIALFGLVIYPLIFFAFGWLYGALIAIIWNAVLGVSGGLQIETEEAIEPVKK